VGTYNPVGVELPELLENFEFLDDWMERYRYIIELGKRLPEMPEAQRTADNKVLGCQSQVWLVTAPSDDPNVMVFEADSDAHIVRGLVAMLLVMFSGKTRAEIAELDPRPTFAELGLDQHLSQGRSNGLLSMVGRIKALAAT
jgi:cysteine desulfuration protein SufE